MNVEYDAMRWRIWGPASFFSEGTSDAILSRAQRARQIMSTIK